MDIQLAARTDSRVLRRVATSSQPLVSRIRSSLVQGVSSRERAEFYTQLAVMLQAKLTLHRSLRVLADQSHNPAMRSILKTLVKDVQ